ncbi:MAG: hypothetical protein O3A51_06955 [Verrucomicrobia bacterium]|nr:hypothetical protein [Verrucomicrobiota bacterium]
MTFIAKIIGLLGIVVCALAVYGRMRYLPTVRLCEHTYNAGTILLVGNSLLLIGIFLTLISPCHHHHHDDAA